MNDEARVFTEAVVTDHNFLRQVRLFELFSEVLNELGGVVWS